jgi:hypothetical protein
MGRHKEKAHQSLMVYEIFITPTAVRDLESAARHHDKKQQGLVQNSMKQLTPISIKFQQTPFLLRFVIKISVVNQSFNFLI